MVYAFHVNGQLPSWNLCGKNLKCSKRWKEIKFSFIQLHFTLTHLFSAQVQLTYSKTSHTDHLYRSTPSPYLLAFHINEIQSTISCLYFGKFCTSTALLSNVDLEKFGQSGLGYEKIWMAVALTLRYITTQNCDHLKLS